MDLKVVVIRLFRIRIAVRLRIEHFKVDLPFSITLIESQLRYHCNSAGHPSFNNIIPGIRIALFLKELFVSLQIKLTLKICSEKLNEFNG